MIRSKVTTDTTTAAPQVSGRYWYGMVWLIFRRFFCVWWRNSMGQWVEVFFWKEDQFLQATLWFGWYIQYIHFLSVSVRRYIIFSACIYSNRRFWFILDKGLKRPLMVMAGITLITLVQWSLLIHFLRIPTRSTVGMTEGCGAKFWLRYGEIRYGGRAWTGWRCRHQMGI